MTVPLWLAVALWSFAIVGVASVLFSVLFLAVGASEDRALKRHLEGTDHVEPRPSPLVVPFVPEQQPSLAAHRDTPPPSDPAS